LPLFYSPEEIESALVVHEKKNRGGRRKPGKDEQTYR
jgi:hypothetical protein